MTGAIDTRRRRFLIQVLTESFEAYKIIGAGETKKGPGLTKESDATQAQQYSILINVHHVTCTHCSRLLPASRHA